MATYSKCFKRNGPPPLRYRTPSPPRHAIEPISPTASDDAAIEALGMRWANDNNTQNMNRTHQDVQYDRGDESRKRGHGSRGSMDAFASIALATSSNSSQPHGSFAVKLPFEVVVNDNRGSERSSKRAKSEKLPSPEWHRTGAKLGSRPATSYEQSADNRTFEAELLLNFSQEARFSTPWPSHRKSSINEPQTVPSLNGTHGSVFGPPIDDQGPHYGTQYTKSVASKTAETPLGRLDTMDIEYAGAVLSSPVTTSNKASAQQCISSRPLGSDLPFEPGHIHSSEKRRPMESGQDSMEADLVVETVQEPMFETPGRVESIQPVDIQDHSEVASDKVGFGSSALVGSTGSNVDTGLLTETGGIQATKGAGTESIEGNSGHEMQEWLNPPDPLAESETVIVSNVAAVNPEASIAIEVSNNSNATSDGNIENVEAKHSQAAAPAVCAACNFTRNSLSVENDNSSTSWICCDGCKAWFHFACAGFRSEREVRGVDKYRCRKCKQIHGPTTYVRKSSRAHTAIDYAGLHQGVFKTSDETPEHHYIKPIKDGTITFQPESFARMRPELVTAEYFEKGIGMKEPVVIPAHFNPRPGDAPLPQGSGKYDEKDMFSMNTEDVDLIHGDWFSHDPERRHVLDYGQDALDMVIPRDLTVRRVAELYGPEEKVEVIDVKSQNGEGKKWNMRRWADYYESSGNKVVRNVISLEVSQSKLGRLIRRPQIVRDLDLQDSVWPLDLQAKGEYPRVQFYCLMSVADCFTDFHIDFGGSSVFYHILKGKKIFLFIPPKEKHLRKYEEWCMSPAQNWTFLADQTKECYRVDLSEGDTMLIPAGWIHAVWTPEDSLVIGGNFLTRLNYGMQLRIAQIEKATGVARKFRYPHFQKIHWYTALRYMENDPLPESVRDVLQDGGTFRREQPAHYDFNAWGENSRSGRENYHARYYSQSELEGLADLTRYLLRTALIDLGSITDGITTETRNAVKKAIPRAHGEPLDIVKRFAMWSAWKRGESIPSWAFAHAIPEGIAPETAAKLSAAAAAQKEAALQGPRRQSARRASQQRASVLEKAPLLTGEPGISNDIDQLEAARRHDYSNRTTPVSEPRTPSKEPSFHSNTCDPVENTVSDASKKRKSVLGMSTTSHRKPACELCRKRRRACKHRDQVDGLAPGSQVQKEETSQIAGVLGPQSTAWPDSSLVKHQAYPDILVDELRAFAAGEKVPSHANAHHSLFPSSDVIKASTMGAQMADMFLSSGPPKPESTIPRLIDGSIMNASPNRGRSKACNDCRKSKRRCIHDEQGNIDPEKANEAAIPRPAATLKRRKLNTEGPDSPVAKKPKVSTMPAPRSLTQSAHNVAQGIVPSPKAPAQRPAPVADMMGCIPNSAPAANMMGHSPPSENQQYEHQGPTPLSSEAELANQALHQLNNAIVNTPVQDDDKPDPDPPHLETPMEPLENIEDEVQLITMPSTSDLKAKASFIREVPPNESFSQPAASSLVSPPASSHNDAGHTPPTLEPKFTPSSSSSRHSSRHPSRHPKQVQRYTPESGSTRRASSSSDVAGMMGEKSASVINRIETANVNGEDGLSAKRIKARLSSDTFADEESLRLIKELQAQDYGLRRRGRA